MLTVTKFKEIFFILFIFKHTTEAVAQRCSVKKVFLEIS